MEDKIHEIIDLIETGRLSILRQLVLRNRFDLNQIGTESGIAALHYATGLDGEQRAIHTCRLLIDLGANVNIETKYDQVTPLHIAVEKNYAELLEIFLSYGGDLEVKNNENDTPISLAIEHKHENIIEKIVDHVKRKKQNSRLEALRASQACLTPSKRTIYSSPSFATNSPYYVDLRSKNRPQIVIQDVIEISDTDSDADETQYYTPVEERASVNLFELTRENLEEFTRSNRVKNRQRRSLVSRWCENLRTCDRPEGIINNLAKIAKVVTGYANDTVAECIPEEAAEEKETEDEKNNEEEEEICEDDDELIDLCVPVESPVKIVQPGEVPDIIITSPDHSITSSIHAETRFPTSDLTRSPPADHESIEDLISEEGDQAEVGYHQPVQIYLDKSFSHRGDEEEEDPPIIEISESQTNKEESIFDESNFIKSPKADDGNSIVQLVEEYEHRDPELGMKFYELKLVANNRYSSQSVAKLMNLVGNNKKDNVRSCSPNSTQSSIISTAISVPLDYDTDTLREELKSFGYTPGPITKSTKRLYLRKLFRYKKNPRRIVDQQNDTAVQYFSVELQHTLKPNLKDSIIQGYGKLEQEMEQSFRGEARKWRQGNAKKSFIYLLIDPRISQNLPGLAPGMEPHEIWRQFLSSIFYVGKGKSSRPYAHLYEAMELSRKETTPPKKLKDRAKVERILDIWQSQNGVVCLQVFHNTIPAEAFTREAAIIEALGVRSLTNLKSGESYGVCQTWPNRKKKHLGIFLLFKALKMFLLEGESQISPDNL